MGKLSGSKIKLIAVIAAAVVVIGGIAGGSIWFFRGKNGPKNPANPVNGSSEVASEPVSETEETSMTPEEYAALGYHEISFGMPSGLTEKQAGKIKLPEPVWVEPGTKISSLVPEKQETGVFTGWYYDKDLKQMAGPEDTADKNLKLYPRFAQNDMDDLLYSEDFISAENVSSDYEILISVHNIPVEELGDKILVRDLTSNVYVRSFEIESTKEEDSALLDVDPEAEVISIEDDYDLWVRETLKDLDEETRKALLDVSLMDGFSGIPDLKQFYGLEEGDSLERYWREEIGLDPAQTEAMSKAVDLMIEWAANRTEIYRVKPQGGAWCEGHMYQVEILDPASIRFLNEDEETGERVVYYNFTVRKEEFNHLKLSSDIVFISQDDVEGISDLGGLYRLVASEDSDGKAEPVKTGTFTCKKEELAEGSIVAIYNGTLKEGGVVDGDVGYFKVTKALGSDRYDFVGAELQDVIAIPDVFPLPDDGSFGDFNYRITAEQLKFGGQIYREMNLSPNTKVDVGDYVYFYTGSPAHVQDIDRSGIGRIIRTEEANGDLIVTYETASVEEMHSSADMYMTIKDLEVPVEEIDEEVLKTSMQQQMIESGFVLASADYVTSLITGEAELPEDPDMAKALKDLTFKTDTGEEIRVEELRQLANGSKQVEILQDPTVSMQLSGTPEHFKSQGFSQGFRAVFTIGLTIGIHLNDDGMLQIELLASLEQEIVLGASISVDSEWDYIIFPSEIIVDASLRAGTFTGFGIQATIKTKEADKDTEWGRFLTMADSYNLDKSKTEALLNLGMTLEKLSKNLDKIQNGGVASKSGHQAGEFQQAGDYGGPSAQSAGGDLTEKYSAMLENDASYVDLVRQQVFEVAISPDPLHLVEFSVSANLVVKFKVNAMVGFSISYGNAKQINYHIEVFKGKTSTSTADLETSNFRADFFVFGMAGLRAGIEIDARVGIVCTKLDSVGVVGEIGIYAEFYGFLYLSYYKEAGKDPLITKQGSMYFETGIYLEVRFLAQLGDGAFSTDSLDIPPIYEKKWPLFSLGEPEVLVPYVKQSGDEIFDQVLHFPEGTNVVKVPDNVFGVDLMSMDSGEVNRVNKDYGLKGELNYQYEIDGRTFEQYNERCFDVTCYDLESENGKLTDRHSFRYLPATNEIVVRPAVHGQDEIWGLITFTYRGSGFGWSKLVLKRSLKVHWKGRSAVAVVEYYLQREDDRSQYDLIKEGEFSGFHGIEYDLVVNEQFCDQYIDQGYIMSHIEFPDEDGMKKLVDEKLRKYEAAQLAVQQNPNEKEFKYREYNAYQKYADAQSALSKYQEHNQKCLDNRSGTMTFMMYDNHLVVRVYFDICEYRLSGIVLNYDGKDRSNYSKNEYFVLPAVKIKTPLKQLLESKTASFTHVGDAASQIEWYYYDYNAYYGEYRDYLKSQGKSSFNWDAYYDYLLRKHSGDIKPMPEGMTQPQQWIGVIGYLKNPEFKLTWTSEGKVIKEEMVFADGNLPAIPEEVKTLKKPGYGFDSHWTRNDGETFLRSDSQKYRMPYHDLVINVEWEALAQPIDWNVNGTYWRTYDVKTGELIAKNWPPTWLGQGNHSCDRPGYELSWRVRAGNEEEDFMMAMKMPPGGVTMIAVYEPIQYEVIWKDRGYVVKKEKRDFGSLFDPPTLQTDQDEVAYWVYNDRRYQSGDTVPNHDVVIESYRHTHQWEPYKVLREATCIEKGLDQYRCKCGQYKEVVTDCNDNHYWTPTPYKTEKATCVKGRVDYYYCYWCSVEKTVESDEPDPDNHVGEKVVQKGVAPTCTEHGTTDSYYCSSCGAYLSGGERIRAKGHDWSDPVYTWSKDNTSVTASRTCKNDPSHVETEKSRTTYQDLAIPGSYDTNRIYTVYFKNEAFTKQEKTVRIKGDAPIYYDNAYAEMIGTGESIYRVEFHKGRNYTVDPETGDIAEVFETDLSLITPQLRNDKIRLIDLHAEGDLIMAESIFYYLNGSDIPDPDYSNNYSQVYVTVPTSPDGSGSFTTNLPFELEWADGYSDLSLGAVGDYLEENPTGAYEVKVKIRVAYLRERTYPDGWYQPDGMIFEGSFGHQSNSESNWDLGGNVAYFREVEVPIYITR